MQVSHHSRDPLAMPNGLTALHDGEAAYRGGVTPTN